MNTNTLAKHYDRLAPRERITLLMAAEARGDASEQQRLRDSAPFVAGRLPDYAHTELALNVLALTFLTEQLHHLAEYWHALWRLDDPREVEYRGSWLMAADVSAYMFTANADAFRHFCTDLGIDAHQLRTNNHSQGWMLDYAEEHMSANAPGPEQLAARFQQQGRKIEIGSLVTVERLHKRWRNLFDATAGDRGIIGKQE